MHRALSGRALSCWTRTTHLAVRLSCQHLFLQTSCSSFGRQPTTTHLNRTRRSRTFTTDNHNSKRDIHHGDTIYALSTAAGKAGIAVIRISGPACQQIYRGLCPGKKFPNPRLAVVRTLYHPSSPDREILDSEALVLHFPSPRTVTGEDVLELHVHGGSATVKAVLAAIPQCGTRLNDGNDSGMMIRYAEPGEFTRRAFLNDRLDLSQVEALSSTLSAETEQQRRAAVRGSSGALGRTYDSWRFQLLQARAEMEALIDFSEDQHFDESPALLAANVTRQVRAMLQSIEVHERAGQRSELLRSGIKIALLGPPNAGKSSLMNQLVGREASIVSGESGTTRDVVEAQLDIRGYLCTFADTAGFRSTGDLREGEGKIGLVEEEGIRRARKKAVESDVIVVMGSVEPVDAVVDPGEGNRMHQIRFDQETLELAAKCGQCLVAINKRDSVSQNQLAELVRGFKTDVLSQIEGLRNAQPLLISCNEAKSPSVSNGHSAVTKSQDPGGISTLADNLVASFSSMTSLPQDMQDLHGVTERQRQLLVQCRGFLLEYLETVGEPAATLFRPDTGNNTNRQIGYGLEDGEIPSDIDITMAAEQLRYAANCLGRITGRGEAGDVEEILGVVFEKFCVGK